VSSFELPITITAVDGEDNIGFSLTFDDTLVEYINYSTTGTALAEWTVDCALDHVFTNKVNCTATTNTPFEQLSDITLVNFTFAPAVKQSMRDPVMKRLAIKYSAQTYFAVKMEEEEPEYGVVQIGDNPPTVEKLYRAINAAVFETLDLSEEFQYYTGDQCSIDFPADDDDDTADDDDTTDDDDDDDSVDDDDDDDSDDDDDAGDDAADDDGGSSGDDDGGESGCGC